MLHTEPEHENFPESCKTSRKTCHSLTILLFIWNKYRTNKALLFLVPLPYYFLFHITIPTNATFTFHSRLAELPDTVLRIMPRQNTRTKQKQCHSNFLFLNTKTRMSLSFVIFENKYIWTRSWK